MRLVSSRDHKYLIFGGGAAALWGRREDLVATRGDVFMDRWETTGCYLTPDGSVFCAWVNQFVEVGS